MDLRSTADAANSLALIESAFAAGALMEKRDELIRLRVEGHTMLFDGGVTWSVTLSDYDKRLDGYSESLDSAFATMASCLTFLAESHEGSTTVICAIEIAQEAPG